MRSPFDHFIKIDEMDKWRTEWDYSLRELQLARLRRWLSNKFLQHGDSIIRCIPPFIRGLMPLMNGGGQNAPP